MNPEELPPARLPFPVTRAVSAPVEAHGEGMPTMTGRFSTFGDWYEVNSMIEGHFLERVGDRAFVKTIRESRDQMKVLYDHGQDPQIGNKILGPIEDLRSDASYVVPLFDTSYNRDLAPGLKAGVYGSSFRFTVEKDEWDHTPETSDHNPDGHPERTITEARVYEFGPVTFPANPNATAGVRSTTDTFYQRSRDPEAFESLLRTAQIARGGPVKPGQAYVVGDRGPETFIPTHSGLVTPGAAARSDEPPAGTPEEPPEPDTPRPPDPPPDEPATEPEDPPDGGSSDSRSATVDYISREDKVSRVKELESAIEARAAEFTGVFPEDVQAADDADVAERGRLLDDIAAVDARAARIASFAGDTTRTEPPYSPPAMIRTKSTEDIYDIGSVDRTARTPEDRAQKLRDNAMRSLDSTYIPKAANVDNLTAFLEREMYDEDDSGSLHQEATRRVLLTGSPAYKRAFAKYLKNGNQSAWTPEESRAAALAVTGTTTTGGYAVPYIFDPTFIHIGAHTSVNPYRAACRVETISGGNNWRAVTATAITAKWDTEAAASVEGGPTIGQPTFTVQRADAFATVSIETLQDRPDVTEELSSLFGEAKDTLEENSFTLGTGATVYPFGMFRTLAFTAKATATSDVTVLLDLVAVEGDLPLRHRMAPGCAWFFSRSTQRQLELLDTTGYYFKRPGQLFAMGKSEPINSTSGNTGTTLLGYPIWEVPSAVSTLTTDAAQIAVFGDPRNYVIVDRIGMNVEVVPTMLNGATPSFPTGQRGIYCYWRATARPLNVDGMRQLVVA